MNSYLFTSSLSRWLSQSSVAVAYAVLYVVNYAQLLRAYGDSGLSTTLEAELKERLASHGIGDGDILMHGYCILIRFPDNAATEKVDDTRWVDKLGWALSYAPVQYGEHHFFLHLSVARLGSVGVSVSEPSAVFPLLKVAASAFAFSEAEPVTPEQIRADMVVACHLLQQLRDSQLALFFQPIQLIQGEDSDVLYYEALLRRIEADSYEYASCSDDVIALERLHLVERLDASVLRSILQLMLKRPDVNVAANLSALSLRRSSWWHPILAQLRTEPVMARHLTIEVTETACLVDEEEAFAMLQELRSLGCRIALDDMGAGFNTLELAQRLRPDIIKLDKSLIQRARLGNTFYELNDELDAIRSSCNWVVIEGVETEADVHASLRAGAHAVQGFFVERPRLLPTWLALPVLVDDWFKPVNR